jgi:hypothetical protein
MGLAVHLLSRGPDEVLDSAGRIGRNGLRRRRRLFGLKQ